MQPTEYFEQLVVEALDALPPWFQEQLRNIDVVVEPWPDAHTLRRAHVSRREELLGFYQGVPHSRRSSYRYTLVLPDKISIYREPILLRCRSWDEVRALVQHVVQHEIAHHFGISDERLRELGVY